jgi:O-antigen ligase
MVLILSWFLFRKYLLSGRSRLLIAISIVGILGLALLLFTDNPVKTRYEAIRHANTRMLARRQFTPADSFNGIQLRLLEYRFAYEILNEHRAWLLGTTSGYSQDLLNQKYVKANMYLGSPGRKDRGFWDYNFHNQFVETLVRTGLIGLAFLLAIFWLQIGIVRRWKTSQAFFTILILISFFIPQSALTMQTGVFLFVFFPMLLTYSPKEGE